MRKLVGIRNTLKTLSSRPGLLGVIGVSVLWTLIIGAHTLGVPYGPLGTPDINRDHIPPHLETVATNTAEARSRLEEGDVETAMNLYSWALQNARSVAEPRNAVHDALVYEANAQMALALIQRGRFTEATPYLEESVQIAQPYLARYTEPALPRSANAIPASQNWFGDHVLIWIGLILMLIFSGLYMISQLRLDRRVRMEAIVRSEINHRIIGNLQTVISLYRRQMRDRSMAPGSLEFVGQITAIAMVQRYLYGDETSASKNFPVFVTSFTDELKTIYNRDDIDITISASARHLAPKTASTIGFMVCELVSNALRHAFPDGRSGKVDISLESTRSGALLLTVTDNGIGCDDLTRSTGLMMLHDLIDQVNGTVTLQSSPESATQPSGLKWDITLPR